MKCPNCGCEIELKAIKGNTPDKAPKILFSSIPTDPEGDDMSQYLEEMEKTCPSCPIGKRFRHIKGVVQRWCFAVKRAWFCTEDGAWCMGHFNILRLKMEKYKIPEKSPQYYAAFANQIKDYIHTDHFHKAVKAHEGGSGKFGEIMKGVQP